MRKAIIRITACVVLVNLFPAVGQVQLIEQGASGFIPFAGADYNQSNTAVTGGAQYNVEGKFALGATYSQVLSDTLFENSQEEVLPFIITPKIEFEFLEPDRTMPLTFILQGSYTYEKGKDTKSQNLTKSFYTQTKYGGGPELGVRFFIGTMGMVVPCLGYSLYLINYDHVTAVENPIQPDYPSTRKISEENLIVHDILIKSPFNYMFTEIFGIVANPKISLRIGGEEPVDVMASLDLGVVLKFF